MPRSPHARSEIEDVLRRVYRLSRRDQMQVFTTLRDYLGDEVGREAEQDVAIRQRARTLEALAQVAQDLGLPQATAPNTRQFREVAPRLDLDISVSQIVRAWGSWRQAQAALTGGWVQESSTQRALRRATSGRNRTHEERISGIRIWLETQPRSTTTKDYDKWRAQRSHQRDQPPVVTSHSLRASTGLSWEDLLAVARGEDGLRERQRRRAEDYLEEAGPGALVGIRFARLLLGYSHSGIHQLAVTDPDFPVPVADVDGSRAWDADDLRAYSEGRPVAARSPGERQGQILTSRELAERLGIAREQIATLLHVRRFQRCPPPSGRVGNTLYWWKEAVDRWSSDGYPRRGNERRSTS